MRTATRLTFADIAALDDEAIELPTAALVIAADEYSGLGLDLYLDKINQITLDAGRASAGLTDPEDILLAINSVIFLEHGYHGNTENYYDPRNSYLNQVIDRRTGIPITLSIIYMTVANKVGCPVRGVGMPAHFLVKHTGPAGDIYIDPFNGGNLMDSSGCAELLEKFTGGKLELTPEHMLAVGKKQILTRMLTNLLDIYTEAKDYARAIRAADLILMINPNHPGFHRDRGILLAAALRERESIESLEQYLKLAPDTREATRIRASINKMRAQLAKLN